MKSASIVWTPSLYWAVNCVAVSLEWTAPVVMVFACPPPTPREPPYRSSWSSYAAAKYNGPTSYLTPPDHTAGFLPAVVAFSSGSPTEYSTAAWMPPKVGESYITEFARRRLKLDAFPSPKPALRKTLLVETKLPLLTPRKPSVSPYFLNGVSMLPSLTVPHPASRPANESRWLSTPVASSKVICDSNCQIAFSPAPISFLPRKPRYELPVSISFLFTMALGPDALAIVAGAAPWVAPELLMCNASG